MINRKIISLLLTIIVCVPALYRAGFFTYFQLNRDYIAENYCENRDNPITICYGQCFLNKGLMLTADSPNPDKIASTVKAEFPCFFKSAVVRLETPAEKQIRNLFPVIVPTITDGISAPVLRPPIA